MKEISTDAKLSQVYSNHCVRSTTASVGCRQDSYSQNHANLRPQNESSVKFYCDRQTLEKEKESSNILARFGSELLPAAQRQRQELEEDNAE